jgi:tRNA/tmRNA/rRNA uracil-C5-methylase (TrmA/RlmC/RlmD family)
MLRTNPNKQRERFGRDDPYYGVISREELRSTALDEDVRSRFFASGEDEIKRLIETLERTLHADVPPRRVLDYGCGVGRLLTPLARRAESAVGIDVSPSMLAEARRNCAAMVSTVSNYSRSIDSIASPTTSTSSTARWCCSTSRFVRVSASLLGSPAWSGTARWVRCISRLGRAEACVRTTP